MSVVLMGGPIMAFGILNDFLFGQTLEAHKYFGAHFITQEKITKTPKGRNKKVSEKGVLFRLYAPLADDVSIIAEWNSWTAGASAMHKVDISGVWELFVPGLSNYLSYIYHF